MPDSIGVAVIGAGMAGRAHAAAYRTAASLYAPDLPPIRLVSIGDVNPEFGDAAARLGRYRSSAIARSTAARRAGETRGDPCSTRETSDLDTPAAAATS